MYRSIRVYGVVMTFKKVFGFIMIVGGFALLLKSHQIIIKALDVFSFLDSVYIAIAFAVALISMFLTGIDVFLGDKK